MLDSLKKVREPAAWAVMVIIVGFMALNAARLVFVLTRGEVPVFAAFADIANDSTNLTLVAALVALVVTTRMRREGWAFIASAVAIVAAVVLIFGSLFPDVMPAIDPANSLTVTNASSTDYTLTVMTWVAVILTPVVLAYQAWTYWVFRKRLTVEHIPAHIGLPLTKV